MPPYAPPMITVLPTSFRVECAGIAKSFLIETRVGRKMRHVSVIAYADPVVLLTHSGTFAVEPALAEVGDDAYLDWLDQVAFHTPGSALLRLELWLPHAPDFLEVDGVGQEIALRGVRA